MTIKGRMKAAAERVDKAKAEIAAREAKAAAEKPKPKAQPKAEPEPKPAAAADRIAELEAELAETKRQLDWLRNNSRAPKPRNF